MWLHICVVSSTNNTVLFSETVPVLITIVIAGPSLMVIGVCLVCRKQLTG